MKDLQNAKSVVLFANATIASDSTTTFRFDTLGFKYSVVDIVQAATATNTTTKFGVLKITEADVTSSSSATAIVALTGTTNTVTDATNGFVINAHTNTTGGVTKLFINHVGRKRYLFLTIQGGASHSTITAKAELYQAEQSPDSASERGLTSQAFA